VKTIGKAIPLIPRVNSSLVPGAADVSDDRQRLLCRLDMYGLAERTVTGDGNCQVRTHLAAWSPGSSACCMRTVTCKQAACAWRS
jgi:hypothetical protein